MKSYKAKEEFEHVIGRGTIIMVGIPHGEILPCHKEVVEVDGKLFRVRSIDIMKDNFGRRVDVGLVGQWMPFPDHPTHSEPKPGLDPQATESVRPERNKGVLRSDPEAVKLALVSAASWLKELEGRVVALEAAVKSISDHTNK